MVPTLVLGLFAATTLKRLAPPEGAPQAAES
jgi:hypothetical protein